MAVSSALLVLMVFGQTSDAVRSKIGDMVVTGNGKLATSQEDRNNTTIFSKAGEESEMENESEMGGEPNMKYEVDMEDESEESAEFEIRSKDEAGAKSVDETENVVKSKSEDSDHKLDGEEGEASLAQLGGQSEVEADSEDEKYTEEISNDECGVAPKRKRGKCYGAQDCYERTRRGNRFGKTCEDDLKLKLRGEYEQGGNKEGHWLTPFCQTNAMRDFRRAKTPIDEVHGRERYHAGNDINKRAKADQKRDLAIQNLQQAKELAEGRCCVVKSVKAICFCRWFATQYKFGKGNCTVMDVHPSTRVRTAKRLEQLWNGKDITFKPDSPPHDFFCESTLKATLHFPKSFYTGAPHSISDAATKCSKMEPVDVLLKPCEGTGDYSNGYCFPYCKSLGKEDAFCKTNCHDWCLAAKAHMWEMNALQLSTNDLKKIEQASGGDQAKEKQLKNSAREDAFAQMLAAVRNGKMHDGRHIVLENLLRSHVLLCVCVNRKHNGGDNTSICYGEPGGIPYNKNWCQFSNTPSFRKAYRKLHPGVETPPPFHNHCELDKGVVQTEDSGMIITGSGDEQGYKQVEGKWVIDQESPIWKKHTSTRVKVM